MPASRPTRLVAAALRCYPSGWRRRRGDEAAELAALLMRDGVPARSIACSYFLGAARARLALGASRRLGTRLGAARTRLALDARRRLGTVVGALLLAAASLGGPLAFLSATAPAHASTVVVRTHHTRSAHPAGYRQRGEPAAPAAPGLIGTCHDPRC